MDKKPLEVKTSDVQTIMVIRKDGSVQEIECGLLATFGDEEVNWTFHHVNADGARFASNLLLNSLIKPTVVNAIK